MDTRLFEVSDSIQIAADKLRELQGESLAIDTLIEAALFKLNEIQTQEIQVIREAFEDK